MSTCQRRSDARSRNAIVLVYIEAGAWTVLSEIIVVPP